MTITCPNCKDEFEVNKDSTDVEARVHAVHLNGLAAEIDITVTTACTTCGTEVAENAVCPVIPLHLIEGATSHDA